jgi:hypothetical protein
MSEMSLEFSPLVHSLARAERRNRKTNRRHRCTKLCGIPNRIFAQRLSRVRRRNQNDRSTRECFKEHQRKKKRNFCVPLLLCRPTPSTFPPILRCNLLVNIILINTFTRSRLSHARAPSTFLPPFRTALVSVQG